MHLTTQAVNYGCGEFFMYVNEIVIKIQKDRKQ